MPETPALQCNSSGLGIMSNKKKEFFYQRETEKGNIKSNVCKRSYVKFYFFVELENILIDLVRYGMGWKADYHLHRKYNIRYILYTSCNICDIQCTLRGMTLGNIYYLFAHTCIFCLLQLAHPIYASFLFRSKRESTEASSRFKLKLHESVPESWGRVSEVERRHILT